MIRFTYRQLIHGGPRTALMIGVIGAVIGVILVLEGFEQGLYAQLRNGVLNRGGQLIVAQAGVTSMTAARSILPQITRREVEAVEGVEIAHPITSLPAIYEQDGRKTPVFLMVYDSAGGPHNIIRGGPIDGERGIVLDLSLAKRYGLGPGDPFELSSYAFRVAGISADTAALMTPFAFITYDGLLDFYFEADLAGDITTFPLLSFLLVDLAPGAERDAVAAAIEAALPKVDVFTPHALAGLDEQLGRTFFGPVLTLLIGIGYVTGVLVVGLFMFATVGARSREYGVLKALGFSNRALFATVLLEAAWVTALAIPVGIGMAAALGELIEWAQPLYLLLPLVPESLWPTIAACAAFAGLGALLPVRAIAHIEPARVFRP